MDPVAALNGGDGSREMHGFLDDTVGPSGRIALIAHGLVDTDRSGGDSHRVAM